MRASEDEGFCASLFFLGDHLEVLIDDGDGQKDTGTGANSTHEVGEYGEGTNAHATKGSGSRDVVVEVADH